MGIASICRAVTPGRVQMNLDPVTAALLLRCLTERKRRGISALITAGSALLPTEIRACKMPSGRVRSPGLPGAVLARQGL